MQSICCRGVTKYTLSLFFNTKRKYAFKFMDEIMYVNLASENYEEYDLYDIGYSHIYAKAVLKAALFEDIYEELIIERWNPVNAYDWCFDESTKLMLQDN